MTEAKAAGPTQEAIQALILAGETLPEAWIPEIAELRLERIQLTDLRGLIRLTSLRGLFLNRTPVTDATATDFTDS